MDADRFDALAKRLAGGRFSRRHAIRGLAAITTGVFLTMTGRDRADASICRNDGVLWAKDAHCCSETCDGENHAARAATVPAPNSAGPFFRRDRIAASACATARTAAAPVSPVPTIPADIATATASISKITRPTAAAATRSAATTWPAPVEPASARTATSCVTATAFLAINAVPTRHRCISGTCKTGQGGPCTDANACATGNCIDGVCCDGACAGQCEACDVPGSVGTCTLVTGTPHGKRPACEGGPHCGGTCDGTSADSCAYPGNETSCGGPLCIDGHQTNHVCDGAGACQPVAIDCGLYVCRDGTCVTSCANSDDCLGEAYCADAPICQTAARAPGGISAPRGSVPTASAATVPVPERARHAA